MRLKRVAPLVIGALLGMSACEGAVEPPFGPLPVVDREQGDEPEAGIMGRLRIADECVDVVTKTEEIGLVFWSTLEPKWDEDGQTVTLNSSSGETVTFKDGDRVSFGGAGLSSAEGSAADAYYEADSGWVSTPPSRCERPVRFEVASVVDN